MLKNRLDLPMLFADHRYMEGAEIGVCTARFSKILFDNIPGLHLFAVDNWQGKWEPPFEEAQRILSGLNATIMRMSSVEAADLVSDESLDFVYIDAAHDYGNVRADIEAWTPKVRKGGIVAGDDYYLTRHGNLGVIRAVNEYCESNNYDLQTTLWDLNAFEDDQQPNWYFVK